jgi:thioredoxin-related protein
MIRILASVILSASMMSCSASDSEHPEEAGKVTWTRDLDAALASSKTTRKPVFTLFQEIPGCAGCKQFGNDVLSNPLLVEAIQTEFTPLLVHNNKAGKDSEVLKRFAEPSWNY